MAPTWNSSTLSHLHREVTLLPCYFSPFQRHHYRSLNDISFTFPCNIHALLLFSSFCLTFPLRNDHSRVFFACQFSRNYSRQFFRGGAFLYSGFNFSHSDLPFHTRYCIPYMRSGLYQLVIRVKGFRVCALHCDLAITLITHCIIRFCPWAWTPRFQGVELCIASARTTLAVSAVAPS